MRLAVGWVLLAVWLPIPSAARANATVDEALVVETKGQTDTGLYHAGMPHGSDATPVGYGPYIAPDDPTLWAGVIETDPATVRGELNVADKLWASHQLGIDDPHGVDTKADDTDSDLPADQGSQFLAAMIVAFVVLGVAGFRYRMQLQRRRWQKSAAKRRRRRRRDRLERIAEQNG